MDKKNTVIGAALLVGAAVAFYFSTKYAPQPPPRNTPTVAPTGSAFSSPGSPVASGSSPSDATISAPSGPAQSLAPAEYVTLENEFVSIRFTNAGGAIDRIALKKHREFIDKPDPYVINAIQAAPALSFVDFAGLDQHSRYTLVSQSPTEIVYRATLDGRLEVTRTYRLLGGSTGGDPYQVRQETTFRNLTAQSFPLPRLRVAMGTATPLSVYDTGIYLTVGYYNGDKAEFVRRDELAGGGLFKSSGPLPTLERTSQVLWASVKNQFFTTILSPDQPGVGVSVQRVKLDPMLPDEDRKAYGLTGSALFDLAPLAANGSTTWSATFFAGPKEYVRLAKTDNFKNREDKVMQFDASWFNRIFLSGLLAPILLKTMNFVHSLLPSWGWAVVVTTLLLKIVTLPFTLAASRSAKRMAKLAPLMTEVRTKYKDNPAKMQQAMMQLYKDHKVNPLGGCIPILITLPFFIAFFAMLQSAADLRFAPFLWVKDLAAPDTVISFGTYTLPLLGLTHLSLNILPLLMGATMIFQTKLTPTPTTDPAQATMMKIMPLIYVAFCYNFASALSLYSLVNGLFTIGQQMVINRLPEPQLATPAPSAPGPIKNVTPKKDGKR